MKALLRALGQALRGLVTGSRAHADEPKDITPAGPRVHLLSEVLRSLADRHGQDFDALAAELGVPADVDFLRLAFEAARISAVRVNFTTIAPCAAFLRAAAAGKAFSRDREPVHGFKWTSLEPSGPTYRAAGRALVAWFCCYDDTKHLLFDFVDGKSSSVLKPFIEQHIASAAN